MYGKAYILTAVLPPDYSHCPTQQQHNTKLIYQQDQESTPTSQQTMPSTGKKHVFFGWGHHQVMTVGSGRVYKEWIESHVSGNKFRFNHPLYDYDMSVLTDDDLFQLYARIAAHVVYTTDRMYPGSKQSLSVPRHVTLEEVLNALVVTYMTLACELDSRGSNLRRSRKRADQDIRQNSAVYDMYCDVYDDPLEEGQTYPSTIHLLPKELLVSVPSWEWDELKKYAAGDIFDRPSWAFDSYSSLDPPVLSDQTSHSDNSNAARLDQVEWGLAALRSEVADSVHRMEVLAELKPDKSARRRTKNIQRRQDQRREQKGQDKGKRPMKPSSSETPRPTEDETKASSSKSRPSDESKDGIWHTYEVNVSDLMDLLRLGKASQAPEHPVHSPSSENPHDTASQTAKGNFHNVDKDNMIIDRLLNEESWNPRVRIQIEAGR